MGKIHTITGSTKLANQIRRSGKKLVLVGGCFDLIHVGHIFFLQQAKRLGDFLMVFLESDETVRKIKGNHRPINTQKNRAKVLEALEAIDYIALLAPLQTNKAYDKLVLQIKPAIIATTKGDLFKKHKKRQADLIEAKLVSIKKISDYSTSKLAKSISKRFYL